MSQADSDDYDSDESDSFDPPQDSMQYLRSFQFISESPNWLQNILYLGICQLIPIVGPLATLGYQFEVAESLYLRSSPNGYADFDFNKFPAYLLRGLWPFLVALIVSLVLVLPLTFLWIALFIGLSVTLHNAPGQAPDETMIVIFAGSFLVMMILSIGLNFVLVPMSLRAGYSQDFGEAFKFGFVRDFVGKMWVEMILSILFLGLCSIPLMLVGLILCYFGMFFSMAVVMLAQAHLLDFQLYAVYLSKGGEPIPLKRELTASESV